MIQTITSFRLIRRHTVTRRYLAVVPGRIADQRIDTFLVRDRGDGRRGTGFMEGVGKEAITHVEVREKLKGYTVVACRLETGRTHQIRVHLASKGAPCLGDPAYGSGPPAAAVREAMAAAGLARQALHAAVLGFVHPISGEALRFETALPPDLARLESELESRFFQPEP